MPTVTTGGAMSGNSSVCSLSSAKIPNTTSASIDTTVMIGRLMAKSEMTMTDSSALDLRLGCLRDVGGRIHTHRRRRADSLRGADEQRVTPGDARRDLQSFGLLITEAELHLASLRLPILEAQHPRPGAAHIHGRIRHHHRRLRSTRHAAVGE